MAELIEGCQFNLTSMSLPEEESISIQIDRKNTTIGRHPGNNVPLAYDSVSRYHARMELRGDEMFVVDLGSSNGTFVNDARVTEKQLHDGDTVSFGNVEFRFNSRHSDGREANEATSRRATGVRVLTKDEPGMHTILQKMSASETSASRFPSVLTDASALEKARRLLNAIYEFHKQLGSKTDEKEILQTALDLIFDVLPCERGAILTREDEDSPFHPVQARLRGKDIGDEDIALSQTIVDRCLSDRVAILSRDAMADTRFNASSSILLHDIRSAMCAPMISRNRVLAICFVDSSEKRGSFSETDLDFFASLTAEVGILVDNARMRSEMIRSEQMAVIGQTITGMAHNIKNVLLLSQGGIGLLDRCLEKRDIEAVERTWDLIKRGLDRFNLMVNEMLDFTRQRPVVRRMGNINDIVQETCEFVSGDLEKKKIELKVSLDPRVPDCLIDDQGFYRAFLNLVVNASEAVEPGSGHVSVRTQLDDEGIIRMQVEDNGPGIEPDDMKRVFQPFFTTKGSRGTGLGLPMTRKLIESMGGRITCRSEAGQGACFHISIRPQLAAGADTLHDDDALSSH